MTSTTTTPPTVPIFESILARWWLHWPKDVALDPESSLPDSVLSSSNSVFSSLDLALSNRRHLHFYGHPPQALLGGALWQWYGSLAWIVSLSVARWSSLGRHRHVTFLSRRSTRRNYPYCWSSSLRILFFTLPTLLSIGLIFYLIVWVGWWLGFI